MWERFSYYGMRAILVLYLVAETKVIILDWVGAMEKLWHLYGWYTMLVYVMSIPGGMIADKFLGQKKSVLVWWNLIVVAGHGILVCRDHVGVLYWFGINYCRCWFAKT